MGYASPTRPWCRILGLTVLAATLSLAGCGRKGPLELPASAPPTQSEAAAAQAKQARVLPNTDMPGLIQSPDQVTEETAEAKQQVFRSAPAPRAINAPPVDRPSRFLLDPLL